MILRLGTSSDYEQKLWWLKVLPLNRVCPMCSLVVPLSTSLTHFILNLPPKVYVTCKDVGGGWWEGICSGILGLFPQK